MGRNILNQCQPKVTVQLTPFSQDSRECSSGATSEGAGCSVMLCSLESVWFLGWSQGEAGDAFPPLVSTTSQTGAKRAQAPGKRRVSAATQASGSAKPPTPQGLTPLEVMMRGRRTSTLHSSPRCWKERVAAATVHRGSSAKFSYWAPETQRLVMRPKFGSCLPVNISFH